MIVHRRSRIHHWVVALTLSICLTGTNLSAQSIALFDIDDTAYPTMRAKFYAFDAQGNQQGLAAGELSITEDRVARTITNVTCPPPSPPQAISSVLVMDVSGSMSGGQGGERNLDLAKAAARAWILALPAGQSECAITSFTNLNAFEQDFTSDRQRLLIAASNLSSGGGTDYDAALINPMAGGLVVSAAAKHRRVLVLLTDGLAERPDVAGIVAEAKRQDCLVFCVTLGMRAPQSLIDIAAQTGGQVFENVTTVEQAESVYRQILPIVFSSLPCTVEWQSDVQCQAGRTRVTLGWQGQTSTSSYDSPATGVAMLEVSPPLCRFDKPTVDMPVTKSITVTARNAVFDVTDITSSNARFTLTPTRFTLQPNQSVQLTLTYTPADSGFSYGTLELNNVLCPQTVYACGGYPGVPPRTGTLKLMHPNGGETFAVGSDTLISWKGIPAADLVTLDYSTNDGATWIRIDTARGLSYRWRNIPLPTSSACRIRVRHANNRNIGDSVPWDAVRTLRVPDSRVRSVAFDPVSSMLATGNQYIDHGVVLLWDPYTGRELRKLNPRTSQVYGIALSPDGSQLAWSQEDGVALWDVATGMPGLYISGGRGNVAYHPSSRMLAAVANFYGSVNLLDPASGQVLKVLNHHQNYATGVSFSPDGSLMASSSADRTIMLWDAQTIEHRSTLTAHNGEVNAVAFSPDGTMVASGSADRTIKLWDLATQQVVWTLQGHTDAVTTVSFSPDGRYVASGSLDGTVRIWNPESGDSVMTLRGHSRRINSVAFSPDGLILASGSEDNSTRLWSVNGAVLQQDQSDSAFAIVLSRAESPSINMGNVIAGQYKDSLIVDVVRNVGTVPFEVRSVTFSGSDAAAFSLIAGLPVYSVPVGGARFGEVRFRPSRVGLHEAQIVIVTQSDTLVQSIRGMGVAPQLLVVNRIINVGQIPGGTSKDTLGVATVRNVGSSPLAISNVRQGGPNRTDFTVLSGDGSFVLQPGETRAMDIRFTANGIGRTSGSMLFDHDGSGSPAVVQLFADSYDPRLDTTRVTVTLSEVATQAGQSVNVGLVIAGSSNLGHPRAPHAFTATIGVDASILHVSDPSVACTQTDGITCQYTVTGVRGDGDTLLRIPAIATLGATDYAPLRLVDFRWLDSVTTNEVTLRDGSIRITGVCDSGGVRLYVPSDAGFSLASRPNPAGATVDLHFGLAGAGPVTIDVVDQTGRVLMSPVSETRLEAGVYTRSVDLSPLSNGSYMLMLRSGNSVLCSRMDVVR